MESWQSRTVEQAKPEGNSHRLWIACSLEQAATVGHPLTSPGADPEREDNRQH